MSKIYCQNCTRYHGATKGYPTEWCKIIVEDYFSPSHEIVATPKTKNSQNGCFFYDPRTKLDNVEDK